MWLASLVSDLVIRCLRKECLTLFWLMNRLKYSKVPFCVLYFRPKRSFSSAIPINCRQLFGHKWEGKYQFEKRRKTWKFSILKKYAKKKELKMNVFSLNFRKLGADESLFARLDTPDATISLTHQYRMNKTITKLANDLTYLGALKCANNDVANATFKIKVITKTKWIQRTLSPHIDQSVIFLNTGNVSNMNNETVNRIFAGRNANIIQSPTKVKCTRIYTNYCETAIILAVVKELKAMGMTSNMIGIIAPYALQVELLRKSIAKHFDNDIEVNTVDQYQGRDKEVC